MEPTSRCDEMHPIEMLCWLTLQPILVFLGIFRLILCRLFANLDEEAVKSGIILERTTYNTQFEGKTLQGHADKLPLVLTASRIGYDAGHRERIASLTSRFPGWRILSDAWFAGTARTSPSYEAPLPAWLRVPTARVSPRHICASRMAARRRSRSSLLSSSQTAQGPHAAQQSGFRARMRAGGLLPRTTMILAVGPTSLAWLPAPTMSHSLLFVARGANHQRACRQV
jgi:hypothetical protein